MLNTITQHNISSSIEQSNVAQSDAAQSNIEQLKQLCPDLQVVDKYSSSRTTHDTLDEARAKTADKLRNNAAYVRDNASVDRPDPVYKQQGDKYAVGIKYGNRYLQKIFNGRAHLANISEQKLADLLDTLATQVEQQQYDNAIDVVRAANLNTRNKAKR